MFWYSAKCRRKNNILFPIALNKLDKNSLTVLYVVMLVAPDKMNVEYELHCPTIKLQIPLSRVVKGYHNLRSCLPRTSIYWKWEGRWQIHMARRFACQLGFTGKDDDLVSVPKLVSSVLAQNTRLGCLEWER